MLLSSFLCLLALLGPALGNIIPRGRRPAKENDVLRSLKPIYHDAPKLEVARDVTINDEQQYGPEDGTSYYSWDSAHGNLELLVLYENAHWITNIPKKIAVTTDRSLNRDKIEAQKFGEFFKEQAWGVKSEPDQLVDYCHATPFTFTESKEISWEHKEGKYILSLVMTGWNSMMDRKDKSLEREVNMAGWCKRMVNWLKNYLVEAEPDPEAETLQMPVVIAPPYKALKPGEEVAADYKRYLIKRVATGAKIKYEIYYKGAIIVKVDFDSQDAPVSWNRDFYYMRGAEPTVFFN